MFLTKERYVWLIFISLSVIAACSNMASGEDEMYDARDIREELDALDEDNDILYGKKYSTTPKLLSLKTLAMSCLV
ncbi:Thiosulfate dehydrogenase [Lentibacillus sp. JNUCC-1]|uniref:hypothetical protein n=1 Tax=Lentibacillus sp. JNUCC-1 TaxID=2654513 RepID=UPI0012E715CE|nr:hypothetical protein [Lentibacillus sp. JNUCC-1]MUV36345.1 Thiosulfate dehydrogenase [Lentibacillus sp. JNUCC-1]